MVLRCSTKKTCIKTFATTKNSAFDT